MPIDKSSYYNFYLGNGAEFHLMSELFLHGYEASKMSPDIGIDILVTNKARQYFRKENEKRFNLQIKSTFLVNDEAIFYIRNEELDFLLSDPTITTVFCYYVPTIEADPKSLYVDCSDMPWWESEEASWMRQMYETNFRDLRRNGNLEAIEFKGFEIKYFWLNNAQLKRAKNEAVFRSASDNRVALFLKLQNSRIEISPLGAVCPEIQNIFYLLNGCFSSSKFDAGYFACNDFESF